MTQGADEQRLIDEEVARSSERIRQQGEQEREHAEEHRKEEEHWRNSQENQRLGAELSREEAEHERQGRATRVTAELLDLRARVAALEQAVAELVRAQQRRAGDGSGHGSFGETTGSASPAD